MKKLKRAEDLNIFRNHTFGKVRVVEIDGNPWFLANDVCSVLNMGNPRQATSRLHEKERSVVIVDTPGGRQRSAMISESGLYKFIMKSRKPEAKAFQKWVTSEVLPSIRKTGRYIIGQNDASNDLEKDRYLQLMKQVALREAEYGATGRSTAVQGGNRASPKGVKNL